MSYTPTVWKTGDVISSANLNKLENGVAAKQDALTFDQSPTEGSNNPVTSGGVYTVLETKANIEDVTKEISKETARSYMTESVSGDIVKFSDGADDIPMEEVRVYFSPIQEGSGDPSPDNIRPISGRTGVNAEQRNRNLFQHNQNVISGTGITFTADDENGTITVNGTATTVVTDKIMKFTAKAGVTYTLSGTPSEISNNETYLRFHGPTISTYTFQYHANKTNGYKVSFRFDEDTTGYIDAIIGNGLTVNNLVFKPQIEIASDASEFVPPTSKHHAITWEDKGTIYGGYVTNNGKLVALWGGKTFSDLRVQKDSSATYAFAQVTDKAGGANNIICESLKTSSAGSASLMSNGDIRGRATDGYIFFRDDSCETATDYATKYADTRIAYELATPIEYDIDAVEIKSLYGDNVMWSDGDTINVSYHADTETLLDSKIEEAKSQTVSVSGTAPTITAAENTRYICGEVVSLNFTPSSSGVSEVIFTAGSTVPVITLPSTVKMPEWYEIEANHVYEISVLNGVYGAVMSWEV